MPEPVLNTVIVLKFLLNPKQNLEKNVKGDCGVEAGYDKVVVLCKNRVYTVNNLKAKQNLS